MVFWTPQDSVEGMFLLMTIEQFFLLGFIGLISFAHCWGYSLLPAFISLRNAFGLNLSSLKAAPL